MVRARQRVLFVCIHNSARSQMAEAWLTHFCQDFFEAYSAGLEPGTLNPLVVEVMKEVGIDISHKKTQAVGGLYQKKIPFDYVIAVCDKEAAEKCPLFPGLKERLHWSFPDPSKILGTREQKLEQVRVIRDAIKDRIKEWCLAVCVG